MAQQALSSEAETSSRGPLSRIIRQDKMPLLVSVAGGAGRYPGPGWCAVCSNRVSTGWQNNASLCWQTVPGGSSVLLGFGFSALLGFVGYFLTHTFAPEAGGSGIPEIEGAMGRSAPGALVAGIAGQVLRRHLHPEFRHGAGAGGAFGTDRRQPRQDGGGYLPAAQGAWSCPVGRRCGGRSGGSLQCAAGGASCS